MGHFLGANLARNTRLLALLLWFVAVYIHIFLETTRLGNSHLQLTRHRCRTALNGGSVSRHQTASPALLLPTATCSFMKPCRPNPQGLLLSKAWACLVTQQNNRVHESVVFPSWALETESTWYAYSQINGDQILCCDLLFPNSELEFRGNKNWSQTHIKSSKQVLNKSIDGDPWKCLNTPLQNVHIKLFSWEIPRYFVSTFSKHEHSSGLKLCFWISVKMRRKKVN